MQSETISWFEILLMLGGGAWIIWAGVQMVRTPLWIQNGPIFHSMIQSHMRRWGPDKNYHDRQYRYPADDVRKIGRFYIIVGSLFELLMVVVMIWELTGG